MKRINVLVLDESDGGHDISDPLRRWSSSLTRAVGDADLVIRVERGQVTVEKNRWDTNEISGLVEDIAFAYSEGHL
jgi:hypothetical protein